jgi:cell wall-associated NlpC family hydrolase
MKRKRLIAVALIAFVMTTGTGIAFASMIEAADPQRTTQVTKEVLVSGPVKTQTPPITAILKSLPPEVGSVEWMAQEKATKDALRNQAAQKQEELESEIARLEKIAKDTKALNETLVLVKNQIDVTRWVLGGATPRAWDCSGLVTWTYGQLGIELRHSATAQRSSGTVVTEPKIGDLVSFNHEGWKSAYHIGIYVGPDEMLHSGGKPGDKTEIRSISNWTEVNGNSEVVYTRIVETNN